MEIGQEIYRQLRVGRRQIIVMSWGAHAFKVFGGESFNKDISHLGGILFKVQGRHFSGHVMIRCAGNDTYTVDFGSLRKGEFNSSKQLTDLYCDNFTEVIDELVEKQK